MYQGRYLAGALAGMYTKTNSIGYVAAMQNSEVNRGLNAFVLGVQAVNSLAKVYVAWTGAWQDSTKEASLVKRLIREKNIDVINYHQDDLAVPNTADSEGIAFIGYNTKLQGYSDRMLATILCRWDIYYKQILQQFLKGELYVIKNHWIGVSDNAIILTDFSSLVTNDMHKRLEEFRKSLANNKLIFAGALRDTKDELHCREGEIISDRSLQTKINWHIKGVYELDQKL